MITSQTKMLLAISVILLLIYFVYRGQNKPIHNEGKVDMSMNFDGQRVPQSLRDKQVLPKKEVKSNNIDREDMIRYLKNNDYPNGYQVL